MRNSRLAYGLWVGALAASSLINTLVSLAGAQSPAAVKPSCNSADQCNAQGTSALRRGEWDEAIRLFEGQVGYAEDAHDKSASLLAYNNLTTAFLQKKDFLRALAWVQVALRTDPRNEVAKRNLALIQQQVSKVKWPATQEGLYIQYAGRTQWNALCVRNEEGKGLRFRLLAYRMGEAWRKYGPASYGELDGTGVAGEDGVVRFNGDEETPHCRVKMHFSHNAVQLKHEGDCEFGYGVDASGKYLRITSRTMNLQNCGALGMP